MIIVGNNTGLTVHLK